MNYLLAYFPGRYDSGESEVPLDLKRGKSASKNQSPAGHCTAGIYLQQEIHWDSNEPMRTCINAW